MSNPKPFYARPNSVLLYPDWFLCHFCDTEIHHRNLWAFLIRQPEPNPVRPICKKCAIEHDYDKEEGIQDDPSQTPTSRPTD